MLHQLGAILLAAVPTFLLVILLNFYLKAVFFKPLANVLKQRYDVTEGAKKNARESLERAAQKTAEYESAIRAARANIYQAQEQLHKQLAEKEAAELAAARERTEAVVKQAKQDLDGDIEIAKRQIAMDSDRLADQITESILQRGAAA